MDLSTGQMNGSSSYQSGVAHSSPTSNSSAAKRKRSSIRSESSPDEDRPQMQHRPLKRACNECRQQKLKCDADPATSQPCSRCKRFNYNCRIDQNFKRIGKRNQITELERENAELHQRLAAVEGSPVSGAHSFFGASPRSEALPAMSSAAHVHDGVAGSLLELSRGPDPHRYLTRKECSSERMLDTVSIAAEQVDKLFDEYFSHYHPLLPFLDPSKGPDEYFDLAELLYWTIIVTAARRFDEDPTMLDALSQPYKSLLWNTVAGVPQNYHVVKALAILCTWPLPTNSTSTDITFIISGIMMQIALQTGLHRPARAQEFVLKTRIELREEDVRDRFNTWACCNIVTQAISTAYGLPPKSIYDHTLTVSIEEQKNSGAMPIQLYWRLKIEQFVNRVSQKFYNNREVQTGIASENERAAWVSVLIDQYQTLEWKIGPQPTVEKLYLKAAGLHLHLAAFFDSPTAQNLTDNLVKLNKAATEFMETAFEVESGAVSVLRYAGQYLSWMMLSAGFALVKLLHSFFRDFVDQGNAKANFIRIVKAVRDGSVQNNDLPLRLAEVLVQTWNWWRSTKTVRVEDQSRLQNKVMSRMSMSHVFDLIWQWRKEFQFKPEAPKDTAELIVTSNPTIPEVAGESETSSSTNVALMNDPSLPMIPFGGPDLSYDFFDPLSWVLDESIHIPMETDTMGTYPMTMPHMH